MHHTKSTIEILFKYILTLTDQNRDLRKRLDEFAGVRAGDVSNTERNSNSSGLANPGPLKSQSIELSKKDLSNFADNYSNVEKQVDSLKATCKRQTDVITSLKNENKILDNEINEMVSDCLELNRNTVKTNAKRNPCNVRSNSGENSNQVRCHTVLHNTLLNSSHLISMLY